MSTYRLSLFGLILVAACAAPEAEEPALDVAAIEAATTEAFTDYAQAVVAGDVEAASEYVTEDAHFMEPGILITSRQAYVEFVQDFLETADVVAFEFTRHDIFVHPGAAYEYGTYDETVVIDEAEVTIEGNYFVRWEEGEDGRWRMDGVVAGPRNVPEEGM